MRSIFSTFLSLSLGLLSVRPGLAAVVQVPAGVRSAPVGSPIAGAAATAGYLRQPGAAFFLSAGVGLHSSLPGAAVPLLLGPALRKGTPSMSIAARVTGAAPVGPERVSGIAAFRAESGPAPTGPMGLKALLRAAPSLRVAPAEVSKMSGAEARSAGAGIMDRILGFRTRQGGGEVRPAGIHYDRMSNDFAPPLKSGEGRGFVPQNAEAEGGSRNPPLPGGRADPASLGKVNAAGQFGTAVIQAALAAGSYFGAQTALGLAGWAHHLALPLFGVAGLLAVSALGFLSLGFRIVLSRGGAEEEGVHTPLAPPYKFYGWGDLKKALWTPLAEGPLTYIPEHAARPLRFHNRLRGKMSWFGAYALQGAAHVRFLAVEAATGVKTLLSLGSLIRDMYKGNPEAAEIVRKQRGGIRKMQGINILQAVIGVGTSYIVGALVDAALGKDAGLGAILAAATIAISLGNAYLNLNYNWIKATVRTRVIRDFRVNLFGHVLLLPFSFFARERPSEVAVRLDDDVAQIAVKNIDIPAVLPYYGAMAAVAGVMMLITSWKVTLLVTITIPLLGFLSGVYGNKAERLNEARMTSRARLVSGAEEALSNVRDVRGYTAEEIEKARYAAKADGYAGTILKKTRLSVGYDEVMGQFYNFSFYIAVLLIGLFSFIYSGAPTVGSTMAMVGYAGYMRQALAGFISLYTQYRETTGSARRVFDYLAEKPAVIDAPGAADPGRLEGRVEFRDVSFAPEGQGQGVSGVSFTLPAGKKAAVVGKPGSGKSLILDLLMRLRDPDAGQVSFDSRDARSMTLKGLRGQIALLHDRGIWLDEATLRENVTYGLAREVSDAEIAEALKAVGADFALDERIFPEGLDAVAARGDWRMGEGRRRHVELARALLADPSVLLLDGPDAGLSDYEARKLKTSLASLTRGRTVVSVPQSVADAATADLILVVEKGRVVESGTHAELTALKGLYYKLLSSST